MTKNTTVARVIPFRPPGAPPATAAVDNDLHKGATEENRPGPERSSHPGLDENGMPDDPIAIAQDVLGVEADKPRP